MKGIKRIEQLDNFQRKDKRIEQFDNFQRRIQRIEQLDNLHGKDAKNKTVG